MKYIDVPIDGLSVMIGIPAGRDFPALTTKSLIDTFTKLQNLDIPCQFGMVTNSAVIQWARDEVVDLFLKSDANRLFWIDSDMTWKSQDILRMLALSKLYDVVCATYPAKIDRPTYFINYDEDAGLIQNEHGLIEIYGAGLGFTIMSREVVERLADRAEKAVDQITGNEIASVFRVDINNRNRRGEDMAIFSDIRSLGYKVYLDHSINLGHIGQKEFTGSISDALHLNKG